MSESGMTFDYKFTPKPGASRGDVHGIERLSGNAGIELLSGNAGIELFSGNAAIELLSGNSGIELLSGNDGIEPVLARLWTSVRPEDVPPPFPCDPPHNQQQTVFPDTTKHPPVEPAEAVRIDLCLIRQCLKTHDPEPNDEDRFIRLCYLLKSAYEQFFPSPGVMDALGDSIEVLCSRSPQACEFFWGSPLLGDCLDLITADDPDIIPPLGAVILIRTFLRFTLPTADLPLEHILAALTIASEMSNEHAVEVALTLPFGLSRKEMPDSIGPILELMRLLTRITASEGDSGKSVAALLSCADQLISFDEHLYPPLTDRGILPALVAYVRDTNRRDPFWVFPELIRLVDCVRESVSAADARSIAEQINPVAYCVSIGGYGEPDAAIALQLITDLLDPTPELLDKFGVAFEQADYRGKRLWLEFLYRGALTGEARFFTVGLHSAVVRRFAFFLNDLTPDTEVYLGLLRVMSDPPADVDADHCRDLLASFFVNLAEPAFPEPGEPFIEQEGSVSARIHTILNAFSHENEELCFSSRFTETGVNLWEQAAIVRANLHMLNPDGFPDDEGLSPSW
jgi:hypothetical protein